MAEKVEKKVEEPKVETPVVKEVKADSPAAKEFQGIMEAYKVQNPVKYELKKAAFEAKLEALNK